MHHFIRPIVFTFVFALALPAAPFAAEKMPAGIIALSDSAMSLADAKTYCQQQGGKLPLVGGSENFDHEDLARSTRIESFGNYGSPWPPSMPHGTYWTGTVHSDNPDRSWIVDQYSGNITADYVRQGGTYRVACVQ